MPNLLLPRQIAQLAGGVTTHRFEERTLAGLIAAAHKQFPALKDTLLDGHGNISPFIGVFIDGEQADPGEPQNLEQNATVQLVSAVAGG